VQFIHLADRFVNFLSIYQHFLCSIHVPWHNTSFLSALLPPRHSVCSQPRTFLEDDPAMELRIEGLNKVYKGGVRALDNVSLTIPCGLYGLLGPNGAGKSTLMRTIATLQEPDSGSIRLGSLDVLRSKDEVRRVLGYLPQDFGVYPRVNAEEMLDQIALLKGIVNRKQRKEAVHELLHRVNLWDHRKKRLTGYSGGMRQRFGIAQALVGNPQLLIVDEPTAGLDPG
jgi:ABC-type multidrug transport system ATPase subunit